MQPVELELTMVALTEVVAGCGGSGFDAWLA
jgi:hypothetical protein